MYPKSILQALVMMVLCIIVVGILSAVILTIFIVAGLAALVVTAIIIKNLFARKPPKCIFPQIEDVPVYIETGGQSRN